MRVTTTPGHVMSADETRAEWITVTTVSSGLEADIARSLLEAEGIPVLVRSDSAGIFGLAFQGNIAGGIALQVPSPEAERARALLDGDDPADELDEGDGSRRTDVVDDVNDQADGADD